MAAVALLSSCSKDDGGVTIDKGNGEGNGDANNPVLIQLGTDLITSNTTQTRASLNEWDNTEVGILGLAENAVNAWDFSQYNSTCIMPNVKGKITSAGEAQEVVFDGSHYYPLDNTINYSFYGYYPYADGTDNKIIASATDNVISATYSAFDGTQDILWGKIKATQLDINASTDGNIYDGFNARYFRKMKNKTTPNIEFNHKLVRLVFNISGGEGTINDLQVTSIKLVNVPKEISLIVADKVTNINEGTISYTQATDSYTLKEKNGADATSVNLHNGVEAVNKVTMGESIMVPAEIAKANSGNYTAEIQLAFKSGGSTISPSTITITPPTDKTFTAGNSYNINIKIHGLTEIKVTATLAPWGDGGNSDIEIN